MRSMTKKNKSFHLKGAAKVAIFAVALVLTIAGCTIAGTRYTRSNADAAMKEINAEPNMILRVTESVQGDTLLNYGSENGDPVYDDDLGDGDISKDYYGDDTSGTAPGEIYDAVAPVNLTVTVDGRSYSLLTLAASVGEALREQNISIGAGDIVRGADLDSVPVNGMEVSVVRVKSDTRTEVTTIPYETVYVWDADMMEGEYSTLTKGKNGSITRTYTLIYEDGVLVSEVLSDETKVKKVDERIAYGSRSSFSNSRGERIDYTKCITCYGTAYIPDARWGYQTYVGERARPGVIAVDPDVIPIGTKVYIECPYSDIGDYGYAIAWDVGTHVVGNWVDLFVENMDEVMRWGARDVNVYILEDQSIDIFALRSDYFVFMDE
ncbi:MAG: G5 domain-containing protein [Clostridia bacterium]|nr:G5 domain-containing protein [Clostridia bacterium]